LLFWAPKELDQATKATPFVAGNEGVVRKNAAGDFCQIDEAAKVAPFAAGNEGIVRKSAAGDFCQIN
jgi:hypothetical protein